MPLELKVDRFPEADHNYIVMFFWARNFEQETSGGLQRGKPSCRTVVGNGAEQLCCVRGPGFQCK